MHVPVMLQTAESKRDRESTSTPPGVCDNQVLDRSQTLDSKDGEMSEWLKEHAWKACVGETLPWVRIPLSPPAFARLRRASARPAREPTTREGRFADTMRSRP